MATIINALYNNNELNPYCWQTGNMQKIFIWQALRQWINDLRRRRFVAIDFRDSEKAEYRKVNFNPAAHGYSILVVDNGGSHESLIQDYADVHLK